MRSGKVLLRLADALVLLLLFLLPWMLVVGAGEGTDARAGMLFWVLFLLPMLLLPWLLASRAPETTAERPHEPAVRADEDASRSAALAGSVASVVNVEHSYVRGDVTILEGRLRVDQMQAFQRLEAALAPEGRIPLIEALPGGGVRVTAVPMGLEATLRRRSSVWINIGLFLATVLTTVFAGALHRGVNLLNDPSQFPVGLPYAAALLGILGVHEMGHFIVARRHGVEVTWPYFIPLPMGLGTLGAFIQMQSLIKSRRAIFDIGIAGPLAGLVIALPALYFGLQDAVPAPRGATQGVHAGMSVLLALLYQLGHGGSLSEAADTVVRLSPMALAGWIGLLITALNLLPVGQLDGGHIAYALFGRRHARIISVVTVVAMLGLGLTVWPGLLTWALLVTLIAGFSHLPAADDITPPGATRYALGTVAAALLLLIIIPLPGAMRGMMLDCPYM